MLRINHNKPFVTYIGTTPIVPGVNTFDGEKEVALRADPALTEHLKSGFLVEMVGDAPSIPAVKAAPKPVAVTPSFKTTVNTNVGDVVKAVQSMIRIDELEHIAENDKRKGVQAAVKSRLDVLTADEEI